MLEKYIQTKIIPVVVVENEDETRKIAELCLEFLPSIELTLRTEYGYKALEILAKDYPNIQRSAATVLNIEQVKRVVDLGTNIIISPGLQPAMLEYAKNKNYYYIPGAATPSEVEQCLAYGYKYIKFFHAALYGGINWIKSIAPVYKHTGVKFMPLGGVNIDNVKEYLQNEYVFACGGTWLCPRNLIEEKNWKEIKRRFEEANKLIKELQN
ncbi:bifunctional 4-hydroxy-2-oxoglutarate aldolase/2-dehydro-3-deoxy-phosphogluconate aldolase [Brachyspira pilosicoli]|uniref:Bifunctional 4-hydroxy-2-oxoglutarate aldolase/2-dehydro-3-deoxy-phosphogluconate aldolase n=1 Tax=Brachyspira pilosicoli TaxID=52584 RepID=A0AAJ6KDE6_BRAPL|nr:bifunctional 4-hydroxy-2-oxoglutarate aldolase/2-dehydro-3-deoxy-phosphogluconate aldolase [Brachyspira pilosicoli]WIH90467.1 bifunctional 4-hydroxy-2-oxoglutarate aldolase/2-dehydro-3-deoxy-phosphogluconate aldolase [Brachyspira pilosicoli]WIH92758.1 bifunctional 4-hydroxy-2-oxoglutarate aldolase/2-dehydro-3-deoxy-phosphogluconate aldolase [Brachyspira pilosicoli]WIH95047.1 bifunctional 4-hydroxy-2-oxoglutarate aldolase/2-dehydro-3-deoxy-phosphogluconate aldolase [Brachyspira pilosicoli]